MVERIHAWFAKLTPEEKERFIQKTDRLWKAVRDQDERSGTEPGPEGALEGPGPDASDRSQPDPAAAAELAEAFEEHNGEMYR